MGRESNKKRRETNATAAREKAAAARAQQRRAEQRRRAFMILGSVVGVIVIGAVIALVVVNRPTKSDPAGDRVTAPASVVKQVTSVSDATLQAIGKGNVATAPAAVKGEPPLTANGKPELLYIGAEFCPYCAIERWSLAVALSKFGTFSNLGMVRSATDDGNFASLDFNKSTYDSKYLTFTSVENEDRNSQPLVATTKDQTKLWNKLTGNKPGFPFIDWGNKYALTNHPPLDPTVLGSANQATIAAQLNNPKSKIAQTIGGGANDDIAAICAMTGNQPASVCNTSTVKASLATFGS